VPDTLEVIKKPIIEPFLLFKWLTGRKKTSSLNNIITVRQGKHSLLDKLGIWIRGNFFIPDARCLWIGPSVRYLKKYLRSNPVDAIFTDGPPHTNTYIGYKLSKEMGIPWLSDYQDPWTQVDYYQDLLIGRRADSIHHKMERECFEQASKITIASPTWKKDLESIGAKNVDVIYYGYDETDFTLLKKEIAKKLVIAHIGLLGKDRDPFTAIKTITEQVSDRQVLLRLAGQVDYTVFDRLASIRNLEIENLGEIPRTEALQVAMNAELLLLPINKAENALGRLPGKLYEYLRTMNPILALGPPNCDAAGIIKDTKTGSCIEYEDEKGIIEFINAILHGSNKPTPDVAKIESFSNQNQTKLIAQYLEEIL